MLSLQETPQGIVFKVFVQPRSSKNAIAGLYGDALKIKLTAPPVEGAANKMCIQYLAKCLKVSKSSLEIVSGQSNRNKMVLVKWQAQPRPASGQQSLKRRILALAAE